MFKSRTSDNKESIEPVVVGENDDGSDKIEGYQVHLGNGFYLDGTWATENEATTILNSFLEHMERRFSPVPHTHG